MALALFNLTSVSMRVDTFLLDFEIMNSAFLKGDPIATNNPYFTLIRCERTKKKSFFNRESL